MASPKRKAVSLPQGTTLHLTISKDLYSSTVSRATEFKIYLIYNHESQVFPIDIIAIWLDIESYNHRTAKVGKDLQNRLSNHLPTTNVTQ